MPITRFNNVAAAFLGCTVKFGYALIIHVNNSGYSGIADLIIFAIHIESYVN